MKENLKNINWEEECKELRKELRKELEKREKEANNTYQILRRLDAIGDLLSEFITKKDLVEMKEKEDKAKTEWELWHDNYQSTRWSYHNKYRDLIEETTYMK